MYKPALRGVCFGTWAFALGFLIMMFLSSPLEADQTGESGVSEKSKPIRISSDMMETENRSKLVIFKGNVKAIRGDLTINSDELHIVNFQSSGKMEKMIAVGNVKLKYKDRVASAEQAIYYNKEEKVELIGNPRVWDGDNQISGEVMLLFLQEDKSVVMGNQNVRVNVVYYPREK